MGEEKKLKEPKTFEEQLKILKDRHMIIEDDEKAIKVLAETNYYRVTAYALQFKKDDDYNNKITFDGMYRLYQFDKKLRNLLLNMSESIEISLRTYMAYTLSIKYGAEAHMKSEIFKRQDRYSGLVHEIDRYIARNKKEPLVVHHVKEYNGHFPIWAIVEILSFGMLSKMYSNLNTKDQKIISRNGFNTSNILLESYIMSLAYIRNVCAHYGRLYNKKMAMTSKIHEKYKEYNLDLNSLFTIILAIKELTINKSGWEPFKIELGALVDEYSDIIDLECIGFPEDWSDILNL